MADISLPLERHFHYHRRQMLLGFLFYVVLGIGTVAVLVSPGVQLAFVIVPGMVFVGASFALYLVLRRRGWLEPDPDGHSIANDEWVKENHRRANKIALRVAFVGQVPLMFIAAYTPPDPSVGKSVAGMAILTMVLAGGTLCASYLYYSRSQADG